MTNEIVARYNTSGAASLSATLRTLDANGSEVFIAEHDAATDTFIVVKRDA